MKESYRPTDPVEELLVDQILGHIWRIGRLERAEKAYFQAIDETRCRREGQMELQLNALLVKEEHTNQNASRYHVLAGAHLSRQRPCYRDKNFDFVGGTLLEASVSKEEARPITDLRKQRAVLLDEVLWLEESLRKQKCISRTQLPE